MKINDIGGDRPPEIPIRELHLRHILLVATVGPLSWILIVVLGAWGRGVAIDIGLIGEGTMTFLLILFGMVVAIKLSWMRLLDYARRRTIELDHRSDEPTDEARETEQQTRRRDHRGTTDGSGGIDAADVDTDDRGRRRRDPAFE